ncbi:MAG: primosomal protein N' [Flavobacteriaceae bacterium]|nr:primosomal protein N' [Flavobacteriaceae bacterium]
MYFIDVILPIPLRQTFTYEVNRDEAAFLKPGMRVAVPFGKSKVYTAIVYGVHQNDPPAYETKSIDQILDETPIITPVQLKHWEWIAQYYMCTLGEVIRAALPSAFLLESETIISLQEQREIDESQLSDDEFVVFEALQNQSSLHINDVRSILDRKYVVGVIQNLIEKGTVTVKEEIFEQYKPKLKRYLKLSKPYAEEASLRELLDEMSRAPKQREVLMTLFMLQATEKNVESVLLQKKSDCSAAMIKTLLDKGILEEYYLQKDRVEYLGDAPSEIKQLSEPQQKAFEEIQQHFHQKDIVLLHGVTSSGKTEIYVKLIDALLATGKQILYMLPEIALTTQLISRLQHYFGKKVAVYHSKYSNNERVEVWQHVLAQKPKAQIVIGARSALFLPFQNLGFVIIDEEHEPSFKQYNPAPRYHARDAAIVLAQLHGAKVLLGSATPSLESYFNAIEGKYALVNLKERFGKVLLPDMELVDIRDQLKKRKMKGHFSERLLEEMQEALENNEQVILFQNRRGYAPVVECTTCGVSPQCPNCDVSLTYHQYKNQLKCHYCGHTMAMLISCMACGNETLDEKGLGTEQIEAEVKALFPEHTVARMDQDTTKGKHAYAKLIERMEEKEIAILVGTQMLAKGLDFREVTLVGVMNADNLLNFPDFRAHERSFQLLQQVSGRAGRTQKRGKVIIQSYNPYHQILQQVTTNNYEEMFAEQVEERYQFKYPPHYRLVKITLKHRNFGTMDKASQWLAQVLRMALKENVLGPVSPPVARIRNEYLTHILVKIPKEQSLAKTKGYVQNSLQKFNAVKEFARVKVVVDVDNY